MPGPLLPDITPDWLKPQNASVFDPMWTRILRRVAAVTGITDPNAAVMGMTAPIETGPGEGAVQQGLAYLEGKFPKLAGYIKAYHGSPHDFERFDASKIGTGEGAQAYGHGLYFAEREGVAKAYRDQLSGQTYNPDWMTKHLRELDLMGEIDRITDTIGRESLARGAKGAPGWGNIGAEHPDVVAQWQPQIDRLNTELSTVRREMSAIPQTIDRPGKMYEVGINAHPDHFLDWDKPLSEQSQYVKDALAPFWKEPHHANYTGQEIYRATQAPINPLTMSKQSVSDSAAAAANALNEKGIAGIKYLDQGSRATAGGELLGVANDGTGWRAKIVVRNRAGLGFQGAPTDAFTTSQPFPTREAAESWANDKISGGSRNFVVFDDRLVDVLRKYGIAVPFAGGAGLAAAQQQQQGQGQP